MGPPGRKSKRLPRPFPSCGTGCHGAASLLCVAGLGRAAGRAAGPGRAGSAPEHSAFPAIRGRKQISEFFTSLNMTWQDDVYTV